MNRKHVTLPHIARAAIAGGAIFAHAAFASPVLLNTEGTGVANATNLANGVLISNSFIVQTRDPVTGGVSFDEYGAYRLTQPNLSTDFGNHQITALFKLSGYATSATTKAVVGGAIQLYEDAAFDFGTFSADPSVIFGANNGTQIASFAVRAGGTLVQQAGGWFTGSLTADSVAGSIRNGYFFSAGQDVGTIGAMQLNINTVAIPDLAPSLPVLYELAGEYAQFTGNSCRPDATGLWNCLTVTDTSMLSVTAVPEPASASLLLAGLAAMGAVVRRQRRAKAAV